MALPPFFSRASLAVAGALATPAVSAVSLRHVLGDLIVEVRCPEAITIFESDEWIAELLVNLLARLYPTIRVVAPSSVAIRLKRLARAINPDIDFDGGGASVIVVAVGNASATTPDAIRVRADGWVARVLTREHLVPRGPSNPYAAAAAACLAAAEVFRRAFPSAVPSARRENVSLSLLDYSTDAGEHDALPRMVDLREVAFAGIGAVASGGLWALARHRGIRGELHLVDPEAAELSNLQRYVLLDMESVGKPKVRIASRAVERPGLTVKMHRKKLEALAGERGRGFESICVSVDNVDGRRAAQALLPRIVVNGWTHGGGLGVSWHRFGTRAPCLACLYMPEGDRPSQSAVIAKTLGLEQREASELFLYNRVPTEDQLARIAAKTRASVETLELWRGKSIRELFVQVCGAANMNVSDDGQPEAVPLAHQSTLAGVLMAAELIKRSSPVLRTEAQVANVIRWHDATGPVPVSWTEPFARDARCICSDPVYLAAYRTKWGNEPEFESLDVDAPSDLVVGEGEPLVAVQPIHGARGDREGVSEIRGNQ